MIAHNILILCVMMNTLSFDIKSSINDIIPICSEPELLLEAQRSFIEYLHNYITTNNQTISKRKLKFLQNELKRNKEEYMKAQENSKRYFEIAVNRVILIKRLTTDLDFIIHQGIGLKTNASLRFPTNKDLEFSVEALAGLQRFYHLNVTQLADGELNTSFGSPMTASDCYVIGKVMLKSNFVKQGLPWLIEAFRLFKETKPYNVKIVDVVSAICKGYDVLGDHEKYLYWTKKLTQLKPQLKKDLQHKIILHNNLLQKQFVDQKEQIQKTKTERMRSIDSRNILQSCKKTAESKAFRMICRHEIDVNPKVSKRLKCWYSVGHHPFSVLARFQAEQLFIEPDLILVHNMLNDGEINAITRFARSQYAIKSEVLREKHIIYPFIKITDLDRMKIKTKNRITQRVSHLTGLKAGHSKWFVSNYAVGGHYHIHSDSKAYNPYDSHVLEYYNLTCPLKRDEDVTINQMFEEFKKICRIGSVLIYLSNVERGGATVFPLLGVAVYPVKGSALFWSNLLPSGDIDYALCHGSCPLLQGSKTVAQKFIPYENQDLTCPLKHTKRKIEDIPIPIIKN